MASPVDAHRLSSPALQSLALAKTLAPSHPSSPSSSSSCPSLYVAWKVLRLVNTFRQRVKAHSHSLKYDKARGRPDFCRDYERQAFQQVDKYLGRKARTNRKPRSKTEQSSVVATDCHNGLAKSNVTRLLKQLNEAVTAHAHSLSDVARNNALFIRRKGEFEIGRLSLGRVIQLLAVIRALLHSLGQDLDGTLDHTYIANLEHLLLCLQDQLLRSLVHICVALVREQLLESQKDERHRRGDWFFEFPDARHPLSTTWPWSIRPSLAVIWGVCWKFVDDPRFDDSGNMIDDRGQILVPNQIVEQYLTAKLHEQEQEQLRRSHSYSPGEPPSRAIATVPEMDGFSLYVSAADAQATIGTNFPFQYVGRGPRGSSVPQPHMSQPQPQQATPQASSPSITVTDGESPFGRWNARTLHTSAGPHDQAADSARGLVGGPTNHPTHSTAAPPRTYAHTSPGGDVRSGWLPESDNFPPDFVGQRGQPFSDNAYLSAPGLPARWSNQPAHSYADQQAATTAFEQDLPRHAGRRNIPDPSSVGVTTADISTAFQPQDTYHYSQSSGSFVSAQRNAHHHHLYHRTSQDFIAPQGGIHPFMTPENPIHALMSPPGSAGHSPNNTTTTATAPDMSRKRSHSQISRDGAGPYSAAEINHHSRQDSNASAPLDSGSPHPEQDYDESPSRGSRSYKRSDPPSRDGKYVCTFSEDCNGQTFDRKCEWNKHMDKHDRPYRCDHLSCTKLQGFTYSGGLLRHEREVHGKHGGPKAQLMCPFPECKRNAGKGFTRKENLNEHIRRVHEGKSRPFTQQSPQLVQQAQMSPQDLPYQPENLREQLQEVIAGADESHETVLSQIEPSLAKHDHLGGDAEDDEDLVHEVKRLREDNAEISRRMQQMQEEFEAERERLRAQLQQQQQAAAAGQHG